MSQTSLAPRIALAAALLAGALAITADAAHAAYSVRVKSDVLVVKGDATSDRLSLRVRAGRLEVDVRDDGAADFKVARSRFDRIRVDAGGGNDFVRIDETAVAFTDTTPTRIEGQGGNDDLNGGRGNERLIGGPGADRADGNQGADTVNLGRGDDRFVWNPSDGSDDVKGGRGVDTLSFNGDDADEIIRLSSTGARARVQRNVGNITLCHEGFEIQVFAPSGGSDMLTVDDLAATDVRTVDVDLAAVPGGATADGAADRLIVNGTDGADQIAVAGSAAGAQVTGLAAAVNVARAEPLDNVVINALGGDDVVNASGLQAGVLALTIDGGAGDNVVIQD